MARTLSSTDWDPSVPLNKLGVCFHKPRAADVRSRTHSYLLISILGSMVQYKGMVQGLIFDPATMTTLVNTPAMAHALDLYSQLAALMPDEEVVDPDDASLITSGRCALGFGWSGVCLGGTVIR